MASSAGMLSLVEILAISRSHLVSRLTWNKVFRAAEDQPDLYRAAPLAPTVAGALPRRRGVGQIGKPIPPCGEFCSPARRRSRMHPAFQGGFLGSPDTKSASSARVGQSQLCEP